MERLIRFKNYRNIGINGQEDLILNTTLELGKMGSVITLIGENNLGKSNIIQGILKYSKNSLNKIDDMYDNDFDNELVPEISLIVKDGNYILTHKVILDLKDGINYSAFECSGKNGLEWYSKMYGNKQLWVSVKNGIIQNGGINDKKIEFIAGEGIKKRILIRRKK